MINRRSLLIAAPSIIISRWSLAQTFCCGNSPSIEAQQFFDRLLTPPNDSKGAVYCNAIDAMVASGAWAKIYWMHVYADSERATGLTNLKSASFSGYFAGVVALPTWTTNRGYSGSGSSYIDTQFNESVSALQNDFCIFSYSMTAAQASQSAMIDAFSGTQTSLYTRHTSNVAFFSVNSAADDNVANLDGSGFFVANRTASNVTKFYRNNVLLATSARASVAPKNDTLKVATGPAVISLAGASQSLTDPQLSAVYAAAQILVAGLAV